jgi:hypothetical protein
VARSPATRLRVPVSRVSRIAPRLAAVQRWATFSPARCTTASRPSSAAAGAGSPSGLKAWAGTPSASRARSGLRDRTVTSSPRARSARTSPRPMRPVAPVTVTFMRSSFAGLGSEGIRARGRPGPTAGRGQPARSRSASIAAKPIVFCASGAAPDARASSATAAATASATSRLKTEGTM